MKIQAPPLPSLSTIAKKRPHNMPEYCLQASEQGNVLRLPFLSRSYLVSDPKLISTIVNTSGITEKSSVFKRLQSLTVTKNDKDTAFNNPVKPVNWDHHDELIARTLQKDIEQWLLYKEHNIVCDAVFESQIIILRLIFKQIFSLDLAETCTKLLDAYRAQQKLAPFAVSTTYRLPFLPNLLYHLNKNKIERILRNALYSQKSSKPNPNPILAGTGVQSFSEIKYQMAIAIEMIGTTLGWVLYHLAEYESWQTKLYNAYQTDSQNGHQILERCLQETLRLLPPCWAIEFWTSEPFTLGDYRIPAQSTLMVSPYVMQRNVYYWPKPRKFHPDRYQNSASIEPYTYFPFGQLPESCCLYKQTFQLMKMILPPLIKQFKFYRAPFHRVQLNTTYALKPRNGIKIQIVQR